MIFVKTKNKERKQKKLVSSPAPTNSSACFRLQTRHSTCSAINLFCRVKQNKQTNKDRLLFFLFTFDLDTVTRSTKRIL